MLDGDTLPMKFLPHFLRHKFQGCNRNSAEFRVLSVQSTESKKNLIEDNIKDRIFLSVLDSSAKSLKYRYILRKRWPYRL